MDPFIRYLEQAKQNTINWDKTSAIKVILGNETCDLDSMISTLALGYFHHQQTQPSTCPLVIPVLNIPADDFCLKTENSYVLNKLGIEQNLLVFRNDLKLKEIQSCGLLSVSLVDQHVLRADDYFLAESVTEIYDHRPVDPEARWDQSKVKVDIEEVGSCSTLIAQKILSLEEPITSSSLAKLLYYVISFDTIAFSPEAGRVKQLDINISEKLKKQLPANQDAKALFEELWAAHNDVSHLTPKQLLSKDLKIVEGTPVPGVPMLVEEYFKLPNVVQETALFCEQTSSSTIVLIGLHVVEAEGEKQVHRDVAIYSSNNDKSLSNAITVNLKDSLKLKGYDFCLEEISVDLPNVKYFKQHNIKLTRKHILPLIKDTVVQYKQSRGEK